MNELNELFEQAAEGNLPPDFDQWELAGKRGWTVAHVAAINGHLPAGFDRWEISDECRGWTAAHAAAGRPLMPRQ